MKRSISLHVISIMACFSPLFSCKEDLIIGDGMNVFFRNTRSIEIVASAYLGDSVLFLNKEVPAATSDIRPGTIYVTLISREYFLANDSAIHLVAGNVNGDTILSCFNLKCNSSSVEAIELLHEEGGRGGYTIIYILNE